MPPKQEPNTTKPQTKSITVCNNLGLPLEKILVNTDQKWKVFLKNYVVSDYGFETYYNQGGALLEDTIETTLKQTRKSDVHVVLMKKSGGETSATDTLSDALSTATINEESNNGKDASDIKQTAINRMKEIPLEDLMEAKRQMEVFNFQKVKEIMDHILP